MIFQGLRRHVGHRSDSCCGVELAIVDLVHQLGNSEVSQLDITLEMKTRLAMYSTYFYAGFDGSHLVTEQNICSFDVSV